MVIGILCLLCGTLPDRFVKKVDNCPSYSLLELMIGEATSRVPVASTLEWLKLDSQDNQCPHEARFPHNAEKTKSCIKVRFLG